MSPTPQLSVVIPTLDEAADLPHLLADVRTLAEATAVEIIVVDGGSSDETVEVAGHFGATTLSAPLGRGEQLRTGAEHAKGRWMLFLHADSRLDASATAAVARFLAEASERDFGHFGLRFTESGPFLRAIEVGQSLRERLFGLVYGDQGLLVSRTLYDEVGGYPAWPIMEDVGIIDRLDAVGRRVALGADLRTSPRRYREEGPVRAWLRNLRLITRFRLGTPAEQLVESYVPRRADPTDDGTEGTGATRTERYGATRGSCDTRHGDRHDERDTVVVFLKEPVAGRVKTRLAVDLGEEEALRIYRALATETVRSLRGGPWRVVLYVDPPAPASLDVVRDWLGAGLEVKPQASGDLGDRMAAAIEESLREARRVCIVGSDIPGVTTTDLADAFARLSRCDAVFGPATDGGYWLVGVRATAPSLFTDVEWSTERVLAQSLANADEAGLDVDFLPEKTDVDTLGDVPERLLAGASPP